MVQLVEGTKPPRVGHGGGNSGHVRVGRKGTQYLATVNNRSSVRIAGQDCGLSGQPTS